MAACWSHKPTRTTLLWLLVSIPLVVWDTLYVLLRPHSMPGGTLHWPLWVPYALYGQIDHVYGLPAWEARSGFTGAQSLMNVVETVMYVAYLCLCLCLSPRPVGSASTSAAGIGRASAPRQDRDVGGRKGAVAVLMGFTAASMTLSKTALYLLNEVCSGMHSVGHNTAQDLIFLWIVPNGSWLVFSAYMAYSMGLDIVDGLTLASEGGRAAKRE